MKAVPVCGAMWLKYACERDHGHDGPHAVLSDNGSPMTTWPNHMPPSPPPMARDAEPSSVPDPVPQASGSPVPPPADGEAELDATYEMIRGADLIWRWELVVTRGGVWQDEDSLSPTELAAALLIASVKMNATKCHVCGELATVRSECNCDELWTCEAHRTWNHRACDHCDEPLGVEDAKHAADYTVHERCYSDFVYGERHPSLSVAERNPTLGR